MTDSIDIVRILARNCGFEANNDRTSYYKVFSPNSPRVIVRISNHRTNLETWVSGKPKNNKPYLFISIVFEDKAVAQTYSNKNTDEPLCVHEYVYNCEDIDKLMRRKIEDVIKNIKTGYMDPTGKASYEVIKSASSFQPQQSQQGIPDNLLNNIQNKPHDKFITDGKYRIKRDLIERIIRNIIPELSTIGLLQEHRILTEGAESNNREKICDCTRKNTGTNTTNT